MTNQDVFNKVWDFFIVKENVQSVVMGKVDKFVCRYRGDNGAKCALGVCITDDIYDSAIEGEGVESLLEKFSAIKELFSNTTMSLLNDLQEIHDNDAHWSNNKMDSNEMESIAKKHHLQIPSYQEG